MEEAHGRHKPDGFIASAFFFGFPKKNLRLSYHYSHISTSGGFFFGAFFAYGKGRSLKENGNTILQEDPSFNIPGSRIRGFSFLEKGL